MKTKLTTLFLSILFLNTAVHAESPVVGKKAASRYFQKSPRSAEEVSESDAARGGDRYPAAASSSSGGDHYMALHFGKFVGSQSWEWGERGRVEDVGGFTGGLTYKFDQWGESADLNLRVDYNEYSVQNIKPTKMSFLPLVIFPESSSKFPLYFGFGGGVGVFFKQVPDESTLTFDYQLIAGARFFDIFNNGGFFIETGMKNHIQILNSGQFNGTFLSAGALFTF